MRVLLTLVLLGVLLPSHLLAQGCVDYEDYFHRVGELSIPDYDFVLSLTVSGSYAFAPSHDAGLRLIDISDPGNPQNMGSVETPGMAVEVAVAGNYAYLTDGDFQVINYSDPENPHIVGSVETPGNSRGVALSGNYAFVGDGDSGLQVIDISVPEEPHIVGGLPVDSYAAGVAAVGDLVYLACDTCLLAIDVTTPEEPQIIGSIPSIHSLGWDCRDHRVEIEGNRAYFTEVMHFPLGQVQWAYLMIVDISTPETLQLLTSVDLGPAVEVTVSDSVVYARGIESVQFVGPIKAQLKIIDVSDPETPEIMYYMESLECGNSSTGIAYSDNYLYTMTESDYLRIYDVSNPDGVPVVGTMELPNPLGSMAISGNHAAVIIPSPSPEVPTCLQMFDITDPVNVQISGSVDMLEGAWNMVAFDNVVYVANGGFGLQVIDISIPDNPEIVGNVEIPVSASFVAGFSGSTNAVYITDGENSMHVVDISNPAQPHLVGSVDTPWAARDVAVNSENVYVIGDSHLQIFDVSDGQNPSYITGVEIQEGDIKEVAAVDDYVYLTWRDWNYRGGLKVVDCSDPVNPQIIGSMTWFGNASDLTISDGLAHMVVTDFSHSFDISVIDISTPQEPHYLGAARLEGSGPFSWANIAVSGDYSFVATGNLLVTIPSHCSGTTGTEEEILDPEINDTPEPLVNLLVHPNPFNPRTTISFSIAHPQNVQLCIYDMTGKRIAVLANRAFDAGVHSMDWQGTDLQGRGVASGTYLLRMSTDERVTSQKMMLIR